MVSWFTTVYCGFKVERFQKGTIFYKTIPIFVNITIYYIIVINMFL